MPQATDEQRELMAQWFRDGGDVCAPLAFLQSRGYTDDRGMIRPPVRAHRVSYEEGACIDYLCDEWDFAFSGTDRPAYA
jgi:hypothetical protein